MMYGITEDDDLLSWTQISDTDLEKIVQEIQTLTPNIGQASTILGALRTRGLNFQRWRVRKFLAPLIPLAQL